MNKLAIVNRTECVRASWTTSMAGLGIIALVAAVGCRPAGPTLVEVTGTVVLDGSPMPDGDVAFDGADGSPPVHAAVIDGRFTLRVVPGEKRVLVNRYQAIGEKNYLGEIPQQSILPERYNTRSELRAIITKDGSRTLELNVTSR